MILNDKKIDVHNPSVSTIPTIPTSLPASDTSSLTQKQSTLRSWLSKGSIFFSNRFGNMFDFSVNLEEVSIPLTGRIFCKKMNLAMEILNQKLFF